MRLLGACIFRQRSNESANLLQDTFGEDDPSQIDIPTPPLGRDGKSAMIDEVARYNVRTVGVEHIYKEPRVISVVAIGHQDMGAPVAGSDDVKQGFVGGLVVEVVVIITIDLYQVLAFFC